MVQLSIPGLTHQSVIEALLSCRRVGGALQIVQDQEEEGGGSYPGGFGAQHCIYPVLHFVLNSLR